MNRHNIHLFFRNERIFFLLVVISILLFACEKEDSEPLSTDGFMYGYARVLDEISTMSGITVEAKGPYGLNSTRTNEDGYYSFSDVANGTYSIQFSKEGYGTLIQYSLQIFESDTVYLDDVALFKFPDETVLPELIKAKVDYRARTYPLSKALCIQTSFVNPEMILFMDTDENVAWNNASFNHPSDDAYFDDESIYTIYIGLGRLPFKTGEKVYVKGYSCNFREYYYGYLDTYLGTRQFTTLDISNYTNVVSFIMP